MPVICRLPGGSGSGSGGTSDLSLNIFTQPDEPEMKDGLWIQRANSHKKIVVDNLISSSGEWSDMTDAPISFDTQNPVIFNGNIVVFGNPSNLWSFNGTSWTQMCDNSDGVSGVLCVLNNLLYCVSSWAQLDTTGTNWGPALFKWTGTAWTKVLNIPVADTDILDVNSCTVYNGYIYMFKNVTNASNGALSTQLLRSNGGSFTTVTTSSYIVGTKGSGVVLNNKVYWLGDFSSSDYSTEINPCIITSTGNNITLPSTYNTPFDSTDITWSGDVFDNIIHAIVRISTGISKHYTFDGSTWTKLFDMAQTFQIIVCAYNTRLYAMGSNKIMYYSKTHEKYDAHTLILQIADTHDGPYETALVNTSKLVTNGRFVTKFNDVFFVGESGLETSDPIYYGDGSKWIKFKN